MHKVIVAGVGALAAVGMASGVSLAADGPGMSSPDTGPAHLLIHPQARTVEVVPAPPAGPTAHASPGPVAAAPVTPPPPSTATPPVPEPVASTTSTTYLQPGPQPQDPSITITREVCVITKSDADGNALLTYGLPCDQAPLPPGGTQTSDGVTTSVSEQTESVTTDGGSLNG